MVHNHTLNSADSRIVRQIELSVNYANSYNPTAITSRVIPILSEYLRIHRVRSGFGELPKTQRVTAHKLDETIIKKVWRSCIIRPGKCLGTPLSIIEQLSDHLRLHKLTVLGVIFTTFPAVAPRTYDPDPLYDDCDTRSLYVTMSMIRERFRYENRHLQAACIDYLIPADIREKYKHISFLQKPRKPTKNPKQVGADLLCLPMVLSGMTHWNSQEVCTTLRVSKNYMFDLLLSYKYPANTLVTPEILQDIRNRFRG